MLIEAKRHNRPIKRELDASLRVKVESTGAQKGVMLATAPFQRGAIEFAKVHGISLVQVTEGRFTYLTGSSEPSPLMSREEAAERFDLPTFVGFAVEAREDRATGFTIVSTEYPDYLVPVLIRNPPIPGSTSG